MDETVKTEQEIKTFTQEEVNSIVQDRLYKERKKYEGIDLDALKEKASKFDEMEEANKTELQKANERAMALETELNNLKSANEIRDIREKVSQETNVPVSLLTGNTEEECKAQAEGIRAYANPTYPTVKDAGEVQQVTKPSAREDFKGWMNQQTN